MLQFCMQYVDWRVSYWITSQNPGLMTPQASMAEMATQNTQKKTKIPEEIVLKNLGPPNSPPTEGCLLATKIRMARPASIQKMVTEKPKLEKIFHIRRHKHFSFFVSLTFRLGQQIVLPETPSRWRLETRRYQYQGTR